MEEEGKPHFTSASIFRTSFLSRSFSIALLAACPALDRACPAFEMPRTNEVKLNLSPRPQLFTPRRWSITSAADSRKAALPLRLLTSFMHTFKVLISFCASNAQYSLTSTMPQ